MVDLKITPEVVVNHVLKQGAVLLFNHPHFPQKPHYFFLLNTNPIDDIVLLFVVATSQTETIDRMIRNRIIQENTIVRIQPGLCKFLPKHTYINCNNIHELTSEHMFDLLKKQRILQYEQVSTNILSNIFEAVMKSNTVINKHKKLLNGEGRVLG